MSESFHSSILLSHGGGGLMTSRLLSEVILPPFANSTLEQMDDAVILDWDRDQVAITTDSYVVTPLFFPGGSIGTLAACGTLNDLAVQGAEPRHVSMGLILEEGMPVATLKRVCEDMAHVLQRRGVKLVTGDTKVVERGAASGLYINMTAVGSPIPDVNVAAGNAQPRDAVIVSGTIGDHGLAIMNEREQLGLHSQLCSDVADLSGMLNALVREFSQRIHVLRDPTRGGVTTAVCDIASRSQIAVYLDEERLPVRSETRGACELLGLEPLNAANEGKALVICPNDIAESVVSFLKDYPQGKNAAKIGETISGTPGQVTLRTSIGAQRILLPPTGQEMPRIC